MQISRAQRTSASVEVPRARKDSWVTRGHRGKVSGPRRGHLGSAEVTVGEEDYESIWGHTEVSGVRGSVWGLAEATGLSGRHLSATRGGDWGAEATLRDTAGLCSPE